MTKRNIELTEDCTVPPKVMAEILNITVGHLTKLVQDKIVPREARGRYSVIKTGRAYCEYQQGLATNKGMNVRNDANVAVLEERAAMLRRENQIAEGELVAIDIIGTEVANVFARVRARLAPIPGNVAAIITGETNPNIVQEAVSDEIAAALNELNHDATAGAKKAPKPSTRRRAKAA